MQRVKRYCDWQLTRLGVSPRRITLNDRHRAELVEWGAVHTADGPAYRLLSEVQGMSIRRIINRRRCGPCWPPHNLPGTSVHPHDPPLTLERLAAMRDLLAAAAAGRAVVMDDFDFGAMLDSLYLPGEKPQP